MMNDENDKPDEQEAEAEEQPLLAGERLAEARRERQISVLEIAKELHLDETKVRALESNDFETLGAPVFAKGHLRKYAAIVGIDESDVLAEYYGLTRSQPIPPVVSERRKPRRELLSGTLDYRGRRCRGHRDSLLAADPSALGARTGRNLTSGRGHDARRVGRRRADGIAGAGRRAR